MHAKVIGLVVALLALAASGCERDGMQRFPAAENFQAPEPRPSMVGSARPQGAGDPHAGVDMNDPHAGVDMNDPHAGVDMNDPHAGLDMDDPHAGLDMNDPHAGLDMNDPHAGLDMNDPHAGMDMGGGDPAMANMEPPDPDRPIDESKFVRGRIRAAPDVADAIEPGAILFLSAWPINPATGEVLGSPVAVDRLELGELPVEFRLDETHMMVKGTRFQGDVTILAHVDGDGEARTKEPGDVEGRARARVPQSDIDLVLDTLLR